MERDRLKSLLDETFADIERLSAEAQQHKSADEVAKLARLKAAMEMGRRICHCTETGEIMLRRRPIVSSRIHYRCPKCARTEKADVPPGIR